jgi:hypothetical protein
MVDRHGNRVTAIVLDGQPVFQVRSAEGYKVGGRMDPEPRTVEDLAAMGVDIGSLTEAA